MLKKLLVVLAVLALLIVIAAIVLWLYIDHAAAKALTEGVTYAGDVPCKVDSVRVSLLSGRIGVDGLALGNPRGFPQADMFTLGHAELAARIGSFWDPPLHIRRLEVIHPIICVEAGPGGTNVAVFLDNVKKKFGEEEPAREQKRLLVDRLLVRDATVRIGSGIGPGSLLTVKLEAVELEKIHGRDRKGVTTGELAAAIVLELVRRGVIKGNINLKNVIPTDVIKGMDTITESAGEVIKNATDLIKSPLDTLLYPKKDAPPPE